MGIERLHVIILEMFLVGFGCLSLLTVFLTKNSWNRIYHFYSSAVQLMKWFGLAYMLLWVLILIYQLLGMDPSYSSEQLLNRMFGKYWPSYWTFSVFFILASIPLWLDKLSRFRAIRFIQGIIFIVISNISRAVILITSIHRHYSPDTELYIFYILNIIVEFAVFLVIVTIFDWIKRRPKKI